MREAIFAPKTETGGRGKARTPHASPSVRSKCVSHITAMFCVVSFSRESRVRPSQFGSQVFHFYGLDDAAGQYFLDLHDSIDIICIRRSMG